MRFRLGAVIGLMLCGGGQSAAQLAPSAATVPTLSIDQAHLEPQRGVLAIRGTGLGPQVVVIMDGDTVPLMPGATSTLVEALAPARVLTTPGTYRLSVVDEARRLEATFVVVSETNVVVTADAAAGNTGDASTRPRQSGPRPLAGVATDAGSAALTGPSPRLIEDDPTQNTAVGVGALGPSPSGAANTAVGFAALQFNVANFNTGTGGYSLGSNTTGQANTGSGYGTLYANTTGQLNSALGAGALFFNTTGSFNVATGTNALTYNDSCSWNVASGHNSLLANTAGSQNVASGAFALNQNTTGNSNTAVGYSALRDNTTAPGNLAIGFEALASNTVGFSNSASGAYALSANTIGTHNSAHGYAALYLNATGHKNVATGAHALFNATDGSGNVAIGYEALTANMAGNDNTAIGYRAGSAVTGSYNVYLGANAVGTATDANTMRLGTSYDVLTGRGQSKTFIAGIYGTQLTSPAQQVFIDIHGQLGILGPPVVSQPISGTLNAVPRDRALETRIAALDALVREQQATIAEQAATAKAQAAALAALQSRVDGLLAGGRRRQ